MALSAVSGGGRIAHPTLDPASVSLRRAGIADLETLTALYLSLYTAYGEDYPVEDIRRKVSARLNAGCQAVLFEHDGTAMGAAVWIDVGDHVFLLTYVIDAAERAQGLGSGLFARLCEEVIGAHREIRLEAIGEVGSGFWGAQGFAKWTDGMRREPEERMP